MISEKIQSVDKYFIILFAIQLILIVLSYFNYDSATFSLEKFDTNLSQISIILNSAFSIYLSRYLFSKNTIPEKFGNETQKIEGFINGSKQRLLVLFCGNIINIIISIIDPNFTFILISLLILVLFFIYRPSEKLFVSTFPKF
ncbi:MAG: hypothetical protein K9J12_16735 [Melioribacteraceae bacterium]|nr:hypothetical protein [Melioribacteraceae bacterium]MCF8263594.1 hypothetical protein [Melioribacteraceae bacterium]MCF8412413.1 hypothetical protein [Melioribacteraceae bacterium]